MKTVSVSLAQRYLRYSREVRRARVLDYASRICWIAGGVALLWVVLSYANAWRFQSALARRFDSLLRSGADGAVLARPHPGAMLGRLEIPRIGLSTMVVEGDDEGTLMRAVGHIPGTALPSGGGNVGLAGHRDTLFRSLGHLHKNDTIVLQTLQGTYRYRVIRTSVVEPDDLSVLLPLPRATLTLVTCYPFHYIGPAPERYIVTASRIE